MSPVVDLTSFLAAQARQFPDLPEGFHPDTPAEPPDPWLNAA
jgi:hypothetical protein